MTIMAKQDDGKNKGVKAPKVENPKPRLVDKVPPGYEPAVIDGENVFIKKTTKEKPGSRIPSPSLTTKPGVKGKSMPTKPSIPKTTPPRNKEDIDIVKLKTPGPSSSQSIPVQTGLYGEASTTAQIRPENQKLQQYRITTVNYPDEAGRMGATERETYFDESGREVTYDKKNPLNNFVNGEFVPTYTGKTRADVDKEWGLTNYMTPLASGVNKENPDYKGSLTAPGTKAARVLGGGGEINELNQLKAKGGLSKAPTGFITPKYDSAGNLIENSNAGLQTNTENTVPLEINNMETGRMYEIPAKKEEVFTMPKFKNGGLVSKIKGYSQGGPVKKYKFDMGKVTNSKGVETAGKAGGAYGSAYFASAGADNEGEAARNMGFQAASQMGPIGGIVAGVTAVGDQVGKPIRERSQKINPLTGELEDEQKAKRNAAIGITLDPSKRLTYKGGLTDVTGDAYIKSMEEKAKSQLAQVKEANTVSMQQQALAAREAGEENPAYYTPYQMSNVRFDNKQNLYFADGSTFDKNMPTFKNGGLVNKVKGYSNGGQVKGEGGPKDDLEIATIEEDSFIVPAENAKLAQGLRAKLLQTPPKKEANLNQKGGIKVKLSNGEHVFTPEEKQELLRRGVNVDLLAPKAENKVEKEYVKFPKIVGMKDGGELTSNKARTILRDGAVRGNPLTDKQKRFFGAIAGGAEVKGYAKGGDVVNPKLEKSKIALEEALVKKLEAEKSRKATDAEKARVKEEVKKSLIEDRKSKELKLAQELKDANTKLKALEKAYTDYSEAKSKPMTETEKKIGLQIEKDPAKIRSDKKKILDDIEKAQKEALSIKKNYDFVRDDNNYIDGYLPKSSVKAPKIDTKKVTPDAPAKTDVKAVTPTEATTTKPNVKAGSSKPSSALPSTIKFTPPEVVERVEDEVIVPTQPDQKTLAKEKQDAATAEALNKSLPQDINQINTGGDGAGKKKGILDRIPTDVDPTLFLGPMQTYLGSKMLRGEKRPVFKPELDPRYNAAVERAQQEAKFGLTPEQRFLAEQNIENIKRDALAQGVNLSGGSGVQAYNLNRSALNDAWKNKLGLKQADLDARINKQRYADQMVADRANIVRGDRRQAFEDAMMGFQQRQKSGSELLGAGLSNMIGSYRFNKDLQEQRRRNDIDFFKTIGQTTPKT
jgi:hypothetical protein